MQMLRRIHLLTKVKSKPHMIKKNLMKYLEEINYPKRGVRHINKDLRHDGYDEYDKTSRETEKEM